MIRRSGVSRCARGACGAVGEAGGAARKSLGRRRSRAEMSRFDDVGCATSKPRAQRRHPASKQNKKTGATRTPFRDLQRQSVKLCPNLAARLDGAVNVAVGDAGANGSDHVVKIARGNKLCGHRHDIGGRERSGYGSAMP